MLFCLPQAGTTQSAEQMSFQGVMNICRNISGFFVFLHTDETCQVVADAVGQLELKLEGKTRVMTGLLTASLSLFFVSG